MKNLDHPNVVKIKEVIVAGSPDHFSEIFIVMEYAQSDLKRMIKSSFFLEEMHLRIIAYNIL
jgi:mitogen-activated protein kinase 1/3